jgi:hypothetical protein
MPNEQNIERIAAYIAQNRGAYDLAALRAQLLAAGYSAEDVDAAIRRLDAPSAPEPPPAAPQAPAEPQQISEPQPSAQRQQAVEPQAPAPPGESGEELIQRMAAYLEQNRRQYTMDALRQQLLNQGQRPELVAAALARVQPATSGRMALVRPALPWAAGAFVLSLVAAGLIAAQDASFDSVDSLGWIIWVMLATAIDAGLGIVLILAGAIVMIANQRQRGMAILFGGLFSLALSAIVVALAFGVCLVLIAQY